MAKEKKEELSNIESLFGKNTIKIASDRKIEEVKEWTKTGSLTLDIATNGGIPKGGKCTCILGKEGSGKSTLLLHIIAEEQKKGNLCFLADTEGTLDSEYAESIGVDLSRLHLVDREGYLKHLKITDREDIAGEEWLELVAKVLKSNIYGIVALDSVAALIPAAEIQNGIAGGRLASVASMMAKAYRTINSALLSSKSAFLYCNQYRMNPGCLSLNTEIEWTY
jgi:recombination protein RecA